jgi:hypothetical protein
LFFFINPKKTIKENIQINESLEVVSEIVKYKVEFIADWSKETHPNYYPANAHFSPFIAYSHSNIKESRIFELGGISTPGVEDMAETGNPKLLNGEIDDLIISELAFKKTQGTVFDSPGTSSSELEFNKRDSYITFVSMLAPSPDWFVSKTFNLIKEGKWVEDAELVLVTYDSGTDSGENLTSVDINTNPKEPIVILIISCKILEE